MEVFLIFLYIFNFNIIKGASLSESVFLVLAFLFFACLVNRNVNRELVHFVQNKYNKQILLMLLSLIAIAAVVPIIQFTFDFSYVTTLIHQFICVLTGILLVGYLRYKKVNVMECIIVAFFIQSLIQIVCFISPTILEITDIFRADELIELRYRSYRGFRGLAISGSGFFGLAVVYGLLFVALAFYLDKWKKPLIVKIFMVASMFLGALSAGRTALFGVAFFIIIIVIRYMKKLSMKTIRNVFATVAIIGVVFLGLRNPISHYLANSDSWANMSYYLFQFMGSENSLSGASLNNVTSVTHMFNDMYFKLDVRQILLGDGRFVDSNGLYYMHTDVGLMRNILFYGIFCTLYLYFFHYTLLMKNTRVKYTKWLAICFLIISILFEVKGQMMGFLIISQSLLILICSNYEEFVVDKEGMQTCH